MSQTAGSIIDKTQFAVCPHCNLQIRRAMVGATASELWHEKCWLAVHVPSETTVEVREVWLEKSRPPTIEINVVEASDVRVERRAPTIEIEVVEAHELPSAPPPSVSLPRVPLPIAPLPIAPLQSASPRRLPRVLVASAGALALAGWFATAPTAGSTPSIEIAAIEPVVWMDVAVRPEVPHAAVDPLVIHKIPTVRGTSIVELYPTLATWIHPVVNTSRVLPELSSGGFGAERDGVMRRECGRGHCGDDITGPIGRPIVAVAAGIVAHVDRSRLGADKRSGRYVKIEHEDGTTTSYMHLNAIVAGLERGDRVLSGQQIGTLGKTAVRSAPPHLHFALAAPTANGKSMRYIDPAPYLLRAKVLDAPDRRPPQKPVW